MAKDREKITIKLEGEQWEKALNKIFQKKVKDVKIDGFRKGSVPKEVYLEKVGIESLYKDAIDLVLDDAHAKALEKAKVKPIIPASADVTDINEKSITFEFEIIGKPEIKLGEYKNLKIKKDDTKVTEKEIEEEIENVRQSYAEIKVKEDGKVEKGDTAVIDFKGTVDGKELDGASGKNYSLEIGSNTFIPGFEDGLIGMSPNETKTLHLKFPENYVKDLANKDVDFEVTLHEIKTRVLPPIDKNFFEDLGYDKVTNLEELKKEVKNVIQIRKQDEAMNKYVDDILNKAIDNMEVNICEEIIHDELHRMLHQFEEQLKMQGLKLEQYLEFAGLTIEDIHKQMEPEAIKRIKMRFLLEEVAEKEKIEVTEEEAKKDAEEMANNYGITYDELLNAFGSMEVLKYDALMRKTLEFLKNN